MKRPPINLDVVIDVMAIIGILVIVTIALMNVSTWSSKHEPCPAMRPRAYVIVMMSENVTSDDMMMAEIYVTSEWFDGFFIQIWPNDSRPPDVFTDAHASGTCYVNGTVGPMPSDNLTLYEGQLAVCYFNLTQANGGIPLTKGKTYYYAVYGRSCGRVGQLARGLFTAG